MVRAVFRFLFSALLLLCLTGFLVLSSTRTQAKKYCVEHGLLSKQEAEEAIKMLAKAKASPGKKLAAASAAAASKADEDEEVEEEKKPAKKAANKKKAESDEEDE